MTSVVYEFAVGGSYTWGAGVLSLDVAFGTTSLIGGIWPMGTPSAGGRWFLRGKIFGTAAASGSASVRCEWSGWFNNSATSALTFSGDYQSTSAIATNGTNLLNWGAKFSVSNGSNGIKMTHALVEKISSSAFA